MTSLAEAVRENLRDPVWIAGHGSRILAPEAIRTVRAPTGVRSFVPDEMTVSCGAGTPVEELQSALAEHGQYVNLPIRSSGSGTVGGALAVGEGDVYRFGRGSVRDVLLRATVVRSSGETFTAGGPTVKNVSGFDVCRLLVGSCGRLGFLDEVMLRTRPRPLAMRWLSIETEEWDDVAQISRYVHRPSSILWSGTHVFVCIEGHPDDLAETQHALTARLQRSVTDALPDWERFGHRWVCSPSEILGIARESSGSCLAEIGTGIVHHIDPPPARRVDPAVHLIEKRLLTAFDPEDRLNGGSRIWGSVHLRTLGTGASR